MIEINPQTQNELAMILDTLSLEDKVQWVHENKLAWGYVVPFGAIERQILNEEVCRLIREQFKDLPYANADE